MNKRTLLTLLILVGGMAIAGGCTSFSRCSEEMTLLDTAKRAYRHSGAAAPKSGTKFSRHFERGWQQGYYNVSKGMGDCPPSVPPEAYWSIRYKNPDGCRKIAAWYDGFRAGATAAQCDARDQFSDVPYMAAGCQREGACMCSPEMPLRSGNEEAMPTVVPAEAAPVVPADYLPVHYDAALSAVTVEGEIRQSSYEAVVRRLPSVSSELSAD